MVIYAMIIKLGKKKSLKLFSIGILQWFIIYRSLGKKFKVL